MNKLIKKFSILFLIILLILSTRLVYISNAQTTNEGGTISGKYRNEYNNDEFKDQLSLVKTNLRARLIIESVAQNAVNLPGVITVEDLRGLYEILCCAHGSPLPGASEGGRNPEDDLGYGEYAIEGPQDESFGAPNFRYRGLARYSAGDSKSANAMEAYILSEAVMEDGIVRDYYDIETDENGNQIQINSDAYTCKVGSKTVFITNPKYVAEIDNKKIEVTKKIENHKAFYVKTNNEYNGSFSFTMDGKRQSFPSFTVNQDNGNNSVPKGTTIHVTGTPVVKKINENEVADQIFPSYTGGTNSYIQEAWWNTAAGGHSVAENALATEAKAFESYINRICNGKKRSSKTEIYDENGEKINIGNAFKIKYNPKWVEKDSEGKDMQPTAQFDENTQTLTVGPFAIDYDNEEATDRNGESLFFAGMTGMEVYANVNGKDKKLDSIDWQLVTEKTTTNCKGMPMPKDKFYIKITNKNIIQNITKITNIKTYYEYMNAAGEYIPLQGTYNEETWTERSEDEIIPDEHGELQKTGKKIFYLEGTGETKISQALAKIKHAARWYEYAELDRDPVDVHKGKLVISKKVIDILGNEIKLDNKFFQFRVNVNGAANSGTDVIRVKAGSSAESKVYYWIGDNKPSYEVTEIAEEGFSEVSIENRKGNLDEIKAVSVIATNKMGPEEGKIQINKEIKDIQLPVDKYFIGKNTQFTFKVIINGDYYIYNGITYKNQSLEISDATVKLDESGNCIPWLSNNVQWYGEAPTYSVEEISMPEGSQKVSINPETGSLIKGETVVVTAVNEQEIEKGSVHIIKTLKNSSELSEDYINSLKFTFELKVEGYAPETIVLDQVSGKNENSDYVWEGESGEYSWAYGNNPEYTIKEIDVPEDIEYVSGAVTENEYKTLGNKGEDEVVIDAPFTNQCTTKKGKLEIVKHVDQETLYERTFRFYVTIEGTFKYKDKQYKNQKVRIGKDGEVILLEEGIEDDNSNLLEIKVGKPTENSEVSEVTGTWTSDEFEWYGDDAPSYKVEEYVAGEGEIIPTIEHGDGEISEGVDNQPIVVTVWNHINEPESKVGRLRIIKTLENDNLLTDDYIRKLEFTFKIKVGNNPEFSKTLQAKHNDADDRWEWIYQSDDYTWREDEEAPKYTIEEDLASMPPGTEFVSASSENTTFTNNKIEGTLTECAEEIFIDNKFVNKATQHKAVLEIKKEDIDSSLDGKEFNFEVKLKGSFGFSGEEIYHQNEEYTLQVTVKGGESFRKEIYWYGDPNQGPEYTVEEKESDIAEQYSISGKSGTLSCDDCIKKEKGNVVVTVVNKAKKEHGKLTITKNIESGNAPVDDIFYFEVTVGNRAPYEVQLKAGETYYSEEYPWNAGDPPLTYTVREIVSKLPKGSEFVSITDDKGHQSNNKADPSVSGTLEKDASINIVAINKYNVDKPNIGKFKISKVVLKEKEIDSAGVNFDIKVKIKGDLFEINGNKTNYLEYTLNLKGGQEYISPEIKWWGDSAPTVTVEEINLPKGWQNIGISNNGAPISSDNSLEIVVTNELPTYTEVDVTMKLAGQVWEDKALEDGKNTKDSVANGVIDSSENAIPGVEVYIYKVVTDKNGKEIERSLATAYKDIMDTEMSFPIITGDDGLWQAPRLKLPIVDEGYRGSFDVVFVYDGQTYEPTKFLKTSNGDASTYIKADKSGKNKFANNSMALDANRDEVNNRIQTIAGKSVINGNGITTGTVIPGITSQNNSDILTYKYDTSISGENAKAISKLITTNSDGTAKDLFKTEARTSIGGLTFPFDNNADRYALKSEDTEITELGQEHAYVYEAIYDYCLHINLGLVRRPDADVGLAKDLYSAKVSVKGTETNQEFNRKFGTLKDKLADQNGDAYTFEISRNAETIGTYPLDLYSTDYYYRAEMYLSNLGPNLYEKLAETGITNEMEVELNYKVVLYNESTSYKETIRSINDYFDSSFSEPTKIELNGNAISGKVTEKNILSSDGVRYNKLVIDNLNVSLASGEKAEIMITFKVQKATIDGIRDTLIKGQKSNVAEIASYSTYNQDGSVAGKVDKDSAPANFNISDYNQKSWYEDDTDSAPVLVINLKDQGREVVGKVWEDKANDDTAIGNGVKDDDEAFIGGLTTQLVEKIKIDDKEYDFLWPTNESLNCLGGESIKDVTGFDSTIETISNPSDGNIGSYKFQGVPLGNYVVRFVYGNDKTDLNDNLNITTAPKALNVDGNNYSNDENILTANYDKDEVGKTPAVYNGQDYKTTIYQADPNKLDSDARDNEARRLEVIANSQTITNSNANVLHTANNKDDFRSQLYEDYYMFADTDKIVFDKNVTDDKISYEENCGLIERPENKIVLDKEISSIKLTTNDGNVIFDAKYDITYDEKFSPLGEPSDCVVIDKLGSNRYLVAKVELNSSSIGTDVMQALNKTENENDGTKNFRFINVDDTILQGTTIEINYKLTALNVSEKDYTSVKLDEIKADSSGTVKQQILGLAKQSKEEMQTENYVYGTYLGNSYYTGDSTEDVPVTTKVRQLVEYIDNNGVFSAEYNNEDNHTWRNTNVTELAGNGYKSQRLLDITAIPQYKILDANNYTYKTTQRNNLALSVDSEQNEDFEKPLVPYSVDAANSKADITLTVTKTVSAQEDANNLTYDNLAEIVKYENSVGRRDTISIPGNAKPKDGEFITALKERDSSATEIVTFTPPTGLESGNVIIMQVLIVVAIALTVIVAGIIIIKKKVL